MIYIILLYLFSINIILHPHLDLQYFFSKNKNIYPKESKTKYKNIITIVMIPIIIIINV